MANAPLKKCIKAGCKFLIRGQAYCERHQKEKGKRTRTKAGQERQTLYDWRWEKASTRFRQQNPLCAECERKGRTTATYCTDHIVPHKGNLQLFWDEDNWQPLCEQCHNAKSRRE